MRNFIALSVLLVSIGAVALIMLSLSSNNGISAQLGVNYPEYQGAASMVETAVYVRIATKKDTLNKLAIVQFLPLTIQSSPPLAIALVNQ